ncbi:MAG: flagellar hook-length control protein, partial [Enterovirga sp.]|nr:flagellar hook-length control protein [Enterovirga sp.]
AAVQRTVSDVPIGRVPIEIGLKALDGTNSFEIRLSPDELGRVDVKLDIDQSGEVRAHLIVERPEALALLTRDRAQLERAFEQAGLRPAQDGIAMSLRDGTSGGFAGQGGQGGDPQPNTGGRSRAAEDVAQARGSVAPVLPRAILSRLGALDLTI